MTAVGDAVLDELRSAGFDVLDYRGKSPAEFIRRPRPLSQVTAIVIHQTGFANWKTTNPNWKKVRAHYSVLKDGTIVNNFDPLDQMRYGSAHANPKAITVEHEGNFASTRGRYWKPEKYGRSKLKEHPRQIAAARRLVEALRKVCQAITHIYAHRQWEKKKSNCCGPELWSTIGMWAIDRGLSSGGPGWAYRLGSPIPGEWLEGAVETPEGEPEDPEDSGIAEEPGWDGRGGGLASLGRLVAASVAAFGLGGAAHLLAERFRARRR